MYEDSGPATNAIERLETLASAGTGRIDDVVEQEMAFIQAFTCPCKMNRTATVLVKQVRDISGTRYGRCPASDVEYQNVYRRGNTPARIALKSIATATFSPSPSK